MAENHIDTAFSALGAVDILFQRCMQGFALWQRVDNVSESIEIFKMRLDLQCGRLACWAREWGIGEQRHLQDRKFRMYESVVMNYLKIIYRITYDLNSLDSIFPSFGSAHNLTSMDSLSRIYQMGSSIPVEFHDSNRTGSNSTGFSTSERLKWALREEELTERLRLLATLIQDLESFLPPPYSDPAGVIILGRSLATYRTQSVTYGLGSRASQLEQGKFVVPGGRRNGSRFIASYDGCSVLVEEKSSITPRNDSSQRGILIARIENIVLRLQDPLKPTELRTLPCQGIIVHSPEINDDAVPTTYSILYKLDIPVFFSFKEIISQKNKSKQEIQNIRDCFPLGRRFVIAQTLARAVMYLHLADWLHKAIRSENIIFFAQSIELSGTTLPYLVGFEYSRPDAHGERTENITDKAGHKFYRHPKAHAIPVADFQQPLGGAGRYLKAYDIYSLGVILTELGLFKSAQRIVAESRDSTADPTTSEIREVLLTEAIPKLKFAMGEIYAEATQFCLKECDNVDKADLDSVFYTNVVRRLELCSG